MPHGNLAAVAGQNIEPVNTDNGNTDHGHDGQKPVTEKQRAGQKKDEEGQEQPPLQSGAEYGHILRVGFLKGPGA